MSIYQDWRNGKKLTDPKELREVQDMFFAIDSVPELTNLELMEIESKRNQNRINQAR